MSTKLGLSRTLKNAAAKSLQPATPITSVKASSPPLVLKTPLQLGPGIPIGVIGNPGASRRSLPNRPAALHKQEEPVSPPASLPPSGSSDPKRASPKSVGFSAKNNSKNKNGQNKNTRGYKGKLNLRKFLPNKNNNNSTRTAKKNILEEILGRRAATNEDIRKEIVGKVILMKAFGEKWSEARYALSQNPVLESKFDSEVASIIPDRSVIPLSLNTFEEDITPLLKKYKLDPNINSTIRRSLKGNAVAAPITGSNK